MWAPVLFTNLLARPESGELPALPPNIDAFLLTERLSQHLHEMLGRSAVGHDVDGLGCDVVIVVVERFFFQRIDQYLQVGLSNRTNQLIGILVIDINHNETSDRV
jgi:hypothetical protein